VKPAIALLSLSVLAALPQQASAWGDEGHKVVALIVAHYLTSTARKQVDAMLATDTDLLTTSPARPAMRSRSRGRLGPRADISGLQISRAHRLWQRGQWLNRFDQNAPVLSKRALICIKAKNAAFSKILI
jgi:hypothetical protein